MATASTTPNFFKVGCDGYPGTTACITRESSFTIDASANWQIGRLDHSRSYVVGGTSAPGMELRVDEESLTYAPNGWDLSERDRLLCPDASTCLCPTTPGATDCTIGGLPGRWVPVESQLGYDAFGNPSYVQDANGHGTTTQFDPNTGGPTHTTRLVTHQGTPLSISTGRIYDASGRLWIEGDENGNTTVHTYDVLGRPYQTAYPSGLTETTWYVAFGYVGSQYVEKILTSPSTPTTWSQQYFDGRGTIYQTKSMGDGGQVVARGREETFGSGRRVVRVEKPHFVGAAEEDVLVAYDDHGRPMGMVQLLGSASTSIASYTYAGATSAGPYAVTMTDLVNNFTFVHAFDSRGLLASRTDAAGTVTYLHDPAGRLTAAYTAGQLVASFGYDSWGRKRRQRDAATGTTQFNYDDVGNATSITDANIATTSFAYDEIDRIVTATDADGVTTYTYDDLTQGHNGVGRLASVAGPGASSQYTYDVAGHVTTRSLTAHGGPTLATQYVYDPLGRLSRVTLPNGLALSHGYTPAGNLASVGSFVTFSNHDAYGQPQLRTQPVATTTYHYGLDGQLHDVSSTSSQGFVEQAYTYKTDPFGNLTSITDTRPTQTQYVFGQNGSLTLINTSETQAFTPDGAYRLTLATGSYGSQHYAYNAFGDITQLGGTTFTYPSGTAVRNGTITGTAPNGTVTSQETLDGVGRRIRRSIGSTVWTYAYDARGHLSRAYKNGVIVADYLYDHMGQRVMKRYHAPNGHVLTTYYSDDYELRSDSAGGSSSTAYVRARGQLVAAQTSGSMVDQPTTGTELYFAGKTYGGTTSYGLVDATWYYLPNHLGSVDVILDSGGAEVGRMMYYSPWGQVLAAQSVGYDGASRKLTGKEQDEEIGLADFGARLYDPSTGRFITPDSAMPANEAAPQSFNRYAYAGNQPVKYVDPDGHAPQPADRGTGSVLLRGFVSALWDTYFATTPDTVTFTVQLGLYSYGIEFAGRETMLFNPQARYRFESFNLSAGVGISVMGSRIFNPSDPIARVTDIDSFVAGISESFVGCKSGLCLGGTKSGGLYSLDVGAGWGNTVNLKIPKLKIDIAGALTKTEKVQDYQTVTLEQEMAAYDSANGGGSSGELLIDATFDTLASVATTLGYLPPPDPSAPSSRVPMSVVGEEMTAGAQGGGPSYQGQ